MWVSHTMQPEFVLSSLRKTFSKIQTLRGFTTAHVIMENSIIYFFSVNET